MNGPQTRYQRLEKLVLAFFIILRKFKHYLQTFPIIVLTEHPLRSIVENPEAIGRISKWASELRSYEIRYEPRTTVKVQVITDFTAHFTRGATEHVDQLEGWIMNMDGASNSKEEGTESSSSLQKNPSSNSPFPSGFQHPIMKSNTRQS